MPFCRAVPFAAYVSKTDDPMRILKHRQAGPTRSPGRVSKTDDPMRILKLRNGTPLRILGNEFQRPTIR